MSMSAETLGLIWLASSAINVGYIVHVRNKVAPELSWDAADYLMIVVCFIAGPAGLVAFPMGNMMFDAMHKPSKPKINQTKEG